MNAIAIDFGLIQLHWYGLMVALAIIAGLVVSIWRFQCRNQSQAAAVDITLLGAAIGLLCARIYYVVLNSGYYAHDLLEVLRFWHGGLDANGALFGFILALFLYCRIHGISFWLLADCFAPGLALGSSVGLLGSFFNQEGFGLPTSHVWGIYIDFAFRPAGFQQFDFFHPLFFYESLLYLLIFLFLLFSIWLQTRKTIFVTGERFLLFLFLSAAASLCLEMYRIPGPVWFGIRQSALTALTILTVTTVTFLGRRKSRQALHTDG